MKTEKIGRATIHLTDCMEFMKGCEDNQFDLAIVDPPYFDNSNVHIRPGCAVSTTGVQRKRFDTKHWKAPGKEYFDQLLRVSRNQIIWGVNYYAEFIPHVGRIVWDKKNEKSSFSKAELASKSFGMSIDIFRHMWNGMLQENMQKKERRIHPTQKPVALYEWLLQKYAKPGDSILDTYMGSGSIAIATNKHGYDLTACELDKDYYQSACERIRSAHNQPDMFTPSTPEPRQEVLL